MRKEEKLFDAITDVRCDLVEEALDHRFVRRPALWKRYGSLAASLVLLIGAAAMFQLGIFGGMGGSDSAMNSAGDVAFDNSTGSNDKSEPADGSSAPNAGDDTMDSGSNVEQGDWPWHEDLILPVTIEDSDDLLVLRDLSLTSGNDLLVEDHYRITSAADRQLTLLCPVVGRPSGFVGVSVTVDDGEEELAKEKLLVGEDLTNITMEIPLSDRGQLDDGYLWAFWTEAEVSIAAGDTVDVCVSYLKPMPVSGEIVMGGVPPRSVTIDGEKVSLSGEGNLFYTLD